MGRDVATNEAALPPELLVTMYARMAMARYFDTIMGRHAKENRIDGWWHPGEGQEAAAIGATAALHAHDYVFYQGRGTAWAIGKGMAPAAIFGDLLGRVNGSTGGKGGGVPHWCDPEIGVMGEGATLGSVYPLAAGAALAAQLRGTGQTAVANFGDGTAARGTFHETMVQAATWKLPLIYFCENNGLIVSMRLSDVSPTENIADYAAGYGIPGVIVDGQDAVAVHFAMSEAVARARDGEGPTLIEAKVVRRRGHWEGDPQQYRKETDPDALNYRDPLDVLGARLDADTAQALRESAEQAVQRAYEDARAAPAAHASIIWKDVYA
ncbi:thiamine pyrophosphate-dependent dehydrogenase E1 component subunit alpha [Pandoraea sp. NPDC087047]|uniref:thiamine pyrophosphate-dependent dehydrogenase E1 component subunit alpha n=1 Tax=Pandoraea sp. NPDC087047 TaxID=3364390 RepID=UPI0038257514